MTKQFPMIRFRLGNHSHGYDHMRHINSLSHDGGDMRQCTVSALVQIVASRLFGVKPLPDEMSIYHQWDPLKLCLILNFCNRSAMWPAIRHLRSPVSSELEFIYRLFLFIYSLIFIILFISIFKWWRLGVQWIGKNGITPNTARVAIWLTVFVVFVMQTIYSYGIVGPKYVRKYNHFPLQWRKNERDGVSNHQPHDCLPNRLFRRSSKKTSKLRITGLCEGNSPVIGEFHAQRASNAENASIWWRHHAMKNE